MKRIRIIRQNSLTSKMLWSIILSCFILNIVSIAIGLYMYVQDITSQSINMTINTAHQANLAVSFDSTSAQYAQSVMKIYNSLTPSQLDEVWTDAYREYFSAVENTEQHNILRQRMMDFLEYSNVTAVYLGMFDEKNQAVVYISDPDVVVDPTAPGDWEKVPQKTIDTFMRKYNSDRPYVIEWFRGYGLLCVSAVPIYNDVGELSAFLIVEANLRDIITGMGGYALGLSVLLAILTIIIAWRLISKMESMIVKPVNEITLAAINYMDDKNKGVSNTMRFSELEIDTGDELQRMSEVMAKMERDLIVYEKNLTSVTAENERIGAELDLAHRIQSEMLPNIFPPFPDRTDLNIFASMDPAKEVGGDFYDFFLLNQDHLGLVMADVSGKGVPAALFMMISRILVRNYVMAGASPRDVLEKVNQQIYDNNPEEMFITIWLGILDLKTGHLIASNAGHEYPILQQAEGKFKMFKDKHGFVVGGMEGMKYTNYELLLRKGAKLFVYTDGVPEATNSDGELFGMDRLLRALNQTAEARPEQVLENARLAVNRFVNGAPQFDDITMMCLEYFGPKNPVKEITVTGIIDNIPVVTDFVNAELEGKNVPLKIQIKIDIVIDEIFGNIARYAYGGGSGEATVRFEAVENAIILTFIDRGITYNPLEAPEPDRTLSAEERPIGGLGIFMVRKIMDEVAYEHVAGCNYLRVKKYF
ncbi:MAG: SpoIIE family protein phosphatase [Blautia sp.]|nr:SpoIIE family protein phosphatase [Blautia sp.]